jgi:predicted NBD/HSP70 family sugar kinase
MVLQHSAPHGRVLRPRQVRGANRAVVLELLREHERLSRVEIARRSGLSEGTVSRIIAELIRRRLVAEDGAEDSTGGRPATRLRLEQNRVAVGVDIQNWETHFSIGSMKGRILQTESFRTPATPEPTLELIARQFTAYRSRFGKEWVAGLGISTRGIVNSDTGVVELGNNPNWVRVAVKDRLQSVLRTPVFVENNVRAAALAEYTFGDPEIRRSHCMLFVAVDDGVGIGIVLDGKVYHGPRMAAGEFGQMVIAASDGPERSDRPGCLERLVANPAVCERYSALTQSERAEATAETASRVRRICQLATSGDGRATVALRETCRYLGIGIANVVWGLDADAVIFDGTMSEAWPLVGPWIAAQFPNPELLNFQDLMLRPSALRGEAATIGAAMLPFLRLFSIGELGSAGGAAARSPGRATAVGTQLTAIDAAPAADETK